MLKLSLAAKQGNGVRYFPHAGYLRLTPLKIEGVVRTKIDEDNRPLLCSNLYVALRCYEARLGLGLGLTSTSGSGCSGGTGGSENGAGVGNGNPNPNVLFEIVVPLWNAASDSEYELLGNGEWPFKIVIPPNASPVCSTVHFQEYRVCWKVEAVLTHTPISGVGMRLVKMHDIPLIRYDAGQELPPQPPNKWRRVSIPSSCPKLPPSTLKYIINTPPFPLAPMDRVPVTLKLSPPPGMDVTSVTLNIERRLTFKSSQSPNHTACPGFTTGAESTSNLVEAPSSSQTSSKSASTIPITSTTVPLTSSDRQTGQIPYTSTITLQIPQAKSLSHWSLGETIHNPLASVRFFLKSKITLLDTRTTSRSPSPSSRQPQASTSSLVSPSPTQFTLDLQEKELYVIATNEADRRDAMLKYREALRRGRKRRIVAPGKEKEAAVQPTTEPEPIPISSTPLTSEPDSSSISRTVKTTRAGDSASRKGKEKESGLHPPSPPPSPPPVSGLRTSKKKINRPNTSEGRTNIDVISDEASCATYNSKLKFKGKSKGKKNDTSNHPHGLTLGFLTPRSRKTRRQCRASDGDGGNIDMDDYDGDYVFVDNKVPLSAPPIRRLSRRNLIPSCPTSPCETSADEGGKVVYFRDGREVVDKDVGTNVSTGTTTSTTMSEGTEEIAGPPTPPDDLLPQPPHLRVCTSYPCRPLALPATSPSSRSWITLPRPLPFLDSLRSSTPTPTSTSFLPSPWDEKGMADQAAALKHGKEHWEIELENTIAATNLAKPKTGKEYTTVKDASGKIAKPKTKKSSTIAAIGFRKKSKKRNSNVIDDGNSAPNLNVSPTSCSESDTGPIFSRPRSHTSPLSPVHIPFSPSSPALPMIPTPASSTLPSPPPISPIVQHKSNSKPRTRTLGFGIGWGFGRG